MSEQTLLALWEAEAQGAQPAWATVLVILRMVQPRGARNDRLRAALDVVRRVGAERLFHPAATKRLDLLNRAADGVLRSPDITKVRTLHDKMQRTVGDFDQASQAIVRGFVAAGAVPTVAEVTPFLGSDP